jgi:hypothetical protein
MKPCAGCVISKKAHANLEPWLPEEQGQSDFLGGISQCSLDCFGSFRCGIGSSKTQGNCQLHHFLPHSLPWHLISAECGEVELASAQSQSVAL